MLCLAVCLYSKSARCQSGELPQAIELPAEAGEKIPFDGIDQTWQNGADRRDSSVLSTKYFVPSIMADINYTASGSSPIDNTVVGSTALARNNEVELSSINFGGDFHYGNARARLMTQFGSRTTIIPRNDFSVYRGQYDLPTMYRYLSEANAGYHFNKWYGINVDAGLFVSYIGLNSYYQVENWEYQASFTSDNTPWFFNGLRIQIFPTKHLKIEPWLVNGWQSYGRFNAMPGIGGNITYVANDNFKILTNNYVGKDAALIPGRTRFHSDNSMLVRYFRRFTSKGASMAAFSMTADFGYEKGGGVHGFTSEGGAPAQYFGSVMFYNRVWFAQNKFAWTIGGGAMTNPGRYLVLYPTGQASPLPDPKNPTQTEGKFPYSANPGDQFKGYDYSTNLDWMPNQSMTVRAEYVHRHANDPYFAGHGGVTSQTGYVTTPLDPNWQPDLTRAENRVIFAILFRI